MFQSVPSHLLMPKLSAALLYFIKRNYLTFHYVMLQIEKETFVIFLHSGKALSTIFEKPHKNQTEVNRSCSEVFCNKGVLRKIHRKTPVPESIF